MVIVSRSHLGNGHQSHLLNRIFHLSVLTAIGVLFSCTLLFKHLKQQPSPFLPSTTSTGTSLSLTSNNAPKSHTEIDVVDPFVTPMCKPHPSSCEGLCDVVGSFVRKQRYEVLSNPKSWMWYYQGVLDYYRCTNAKIIVEVGVAFGAQTAYHLKNGLDFIEEYHIVDPFLAGYDPDDPMSKEFEKAAPGSTPEEVSNAWYQAMAMDLGRDGMYMPEKNEKIDPAPGCHLRMHHEKSVAGSKLFGNLSVDAVFIDGLHTYEGVMEDILSWMPKIKVGGSLIFNDFQDPNFGVNRAVWEVVEKHNINVRMIDRTNALLGGGSDICVKGPQPMRIKN